MVILELHGGERQPCAHDMMILELHGGEIQPCARDMVILELHGGENSHAHIVKFREISWPDFVKFAVFCILCDTF